MTTRTSLAAIVIMLTAATLVGAVATFAPTTTQAETEAESSSTTCINDQPCQTTVSNLNTTASPNENHNRIHMSTTCINDQPCQTTVHPPSPSDDDND
jgi:hypothetical protein